MSYFRIVLVVLGLLALGACSKSASSGAVTSNTVSGISTTSQISAVTAK